MIDFEETKQLIKGFVLVNMKDCSCGLKSSKIDIPQYSLCVDKLNPICQSSFNDHVLKKKCRNFYKNLNTGYYTVICPFGLEIEVSKIINSYGEISLFYHTGKFNEIKADEVLKSLPRYQKKSLSIAISSMQGYTFKQPKILNIVRKFDNIVKTLLTARISESMMALSHEILTPVQGAYNDLAHIQRFVEDHKLNIPEIDRIGNNLSSITLISKKIALLLNPDIKFDQKSYRRIIIHKLISDISKRYTSISEDKRIVFNNNYNRGVDALEAVPDQIEIVFNTLIENAIKYSFHGFDGKPTRVDVHYSDSPKFKLISIESLSCYITPEEIKNDRIFELGYRGVHSNDRKRKGTGSGLFIARKIVVAHGGQIKVASKPLGDIESAPRAVTKFTVHWPYIQ